MPEPATQYEASTRGFERHVQTLVLALLTALCSWMGNTVYGTSIAVTEIKGEVRVVAVKLELLESIAQNSYTERDAERDLTPLRRDIINLKNRVQILETGYSRNGGP